MHCDCDFCCTACGPHARNCTTQQAEPADPSDDYHT